MSHSPLSLAATRPSGHPYLRGGAESTPFRPQSAPRETRPVGPRRDETARRHLRYAEAAPVRPWANGARPRPNPTAIWSAQGRQAATKVLADAGKPMRAKDMVETMLAKGLWKTGGKTPATTMYAAIIRKIAAKKDEARFRKADRGMFALNEQHRFPSRFPTPVLRRGLLRPASSPLPSA